MMSRMATCMVMAAVVVSAASSQCVAAKVTPPATPPIARVVDIFVNSVNENDGELVANATVTLDIVGRTVTRLVEIPITVGGSPGTDDVCPILNLAVGPLDLDLLGLVVELDDCANGPVLVDIMAVAGDGQLLGNLLCAVAGLLDDGQGLSDILSELTGAELALFTNTIKGVLNGVFDSVVMSGVAAQQTDSKGNNAGGRGRRCDILNLELNALQLDLLGLQVETSDICLDVYAERGSGKLLGNLLCDLVKALDKRGSLADQLKKIAAIKKLLDLRGL